MNERLSHWFLMFVMVLNLVILVCFITHWCMENVDVRIRHFETREVVNRPIIETRTVTVDNIVIAEYNEEWNRQQALDRANLLVKTEGERLK